MARERLPGWLIGLFVATLALGTDEFVIAGLLPEIGREFTVSVGTAGQLITVFALTFAVGAPLMGVALDPYPRRRVLVAALLVFVAANVAAAFAPGFAVLVVLRAVAGLSAAVVSSTAFASAALGAPDGRQGRYLSMVTAGLTVALFTGVPAGAWLGGLFGWRATFVVIAIVAALATLVLLAGLPPIAGSPAASLRERLRPARDPRVLRLVVAVFLCGVGGLMFYSYLSALLGHGGALPAVLLMVGVVGVPSALLGGRLADRFGGRTSRLVVVGGHALALALLTGLVAAGAPFPLLVAGIAGWSVFAWALNPPLQASTIEAAPDAPLTAVALNISGLYLGTAAAGALGGLVVDHLGVGWIPPVATLALVLALASAAFRVPATSPGEGVGVPTP